MKKLKTFLEETRLNESIKSSWKNQILKKQNGEVSTEELATNTNYLDRSVPLLKDFDILIRNFKETVFDKKETLLLQTAKQLIKDAQVPRSLLSIKEKKSKLRLQ